MTTASTLGACDQRREMIGIGIGRQNGDAARDAVELDQRQCRCELACRWRAEPTCRRVLSSRPPRLVPRDEIGEARTARRDPRRTARPHRSAMICRSDRASARAIFIDFHEVAESHGKQGVLGGRERIDAELVFEARDQHGKAERIETANRQARDRRATAPESCRARARSAPSGPLWLILSTWLQWPTVYSLRTGIFAQRLRSSSRRGRGQREWFLLVPDIRCRQIDEGDLPAVAGLLDARISEPQSPVLAARARSTDAARAAAGLPKYGYLLETDGTPVGAILLICSAMPADGRDADAALQSLELVCRAAFRAYAPLLVSQALRHKDVTYLNVSAAPHTWPIIEAQGFSRYSDGIFVCLAGAERHARRRKSRGVRRAQRAAGGASIRSSRRSSRNTPRTAASACGARRPQRAYPFVFRPRLVKGVIPCAQLIYCRDIADFARFAGPIGRYLARRGRADRHRRRQRSDPGSRRHVPPRQQAEIFQRPAAAAARRPRLYRIRDIGRVETRSVPSP